MGARSGMVMGCVGGRQGMVGWVRRDVGLFVNMGSF